MHPFATSSQRPIIRFKWFPNGLLKEVLLATVTWNTAGHTVFPIGLATFTHGLHMVNVQLMIVKGFSTVLTLEQVTKVQITATKTHPLLEVMIISCDSQRWNLQSSAGAVNFPVVIPFQDLDLFHVMKFDCLLPGDYT